MKRRRSKEGGRTGKKKSGKLKLWRKSAVVAPDFKAALAESQNKGHNQSPVTNRSVACTPHVAEY